MPRSCVRGSSADRLAAPSKGSQRVLVSEGRLPQQCVGCQFESLCTDRKVNYATALRCLAMRGYQTRILGYGYPSD